jgi:membrane-associated phospholipid phosphatase
MAMMDLQKPWPFGLSRTSWPYFAVGVVCLLILIGFIDAAASRGAIGWPEQWRAPFFLVTDYGLSERILIPSFVMMILLRLAMFPLSGVWKKASGELAQIFAFVFAGIGTPVLLVSVLKRLIGRGRPSEYETAGSLSFQNFFNDWAFQSFPSGHSATAVALAFVVGFIWPAVFPFLLVAGLIVAVSRVPVGAHYPTDVFAGIIIGMIGAYLVRNFFAHKGWLFEQRDDGRIVRKPLRGLRQLFQRAAE